MKLHLPVNLLRAVLALFVAQVAISPTWAESITETYTYELEKSTLIENKPINHYGYDLKITSGEEKKYDFTLTYTEAYDGPRGFSGDSLEVEKLKNFKVENSGDDTGVYAVKSLSVHDNGTVSLLKNAGRAVVGGDVSFSNNDSVDISGSIETGQDRQDGLWGGAMNTDNTTFAGNGSVTLSNNSITVSGRAVGGAISNSLMLKFDGNGALSISGNSVESISETTTSESENGDALLAGAVYGGAIFNAQEVSITRTSGEVQFKNNTAKTSSRDFAGGAAIAASEFYSSSEEANPLTGSIKITENAGTISFINNAASSGLGDSSDTTIPQMAAGGAMYAVTGIHIKENTSGLILFEENSVTSLASQSGSSGGAIHSFSFVNISGNPPASDISQLQDEGESERHGIVFTSNQAASDAAIGKGGAISADNSLVVDYIWQDMNFSSREECEDFVNSVLPSDVLLNSNGDIEFSSNVAASMKTSAYGGAIYSGRNVVIGENLESGNGNVTFSSNQAQGYGREGIGGAIYADNTVTVSGNQDVLFSRNIAFGIMAQGGAIAAENGVSITGNRNVTFDSNAVRSYDLANGGAIYVGNYLSDGVSTIDISNNTGLVKFNNQLIETEVRVIHGGAICLMGEAGTKLSLNGNAGGLEFTNNTAKSLQNSSVAGGALYVQGEVLISGNGTAENSAKILFSGNSVTSNGGDAFGSAIATQGSNSAINIVDNHADIEFSNNRSQTIGYYKNNNNEHLHANLSAGAVVATSTVSITGNGNVLFANNTVTETAQLETPIPTGGYVGNTTDLQVAAGAAITSGYGINLSNNKAVTISGNALLSEWRDVRGGALATYGQANISNNSDAVSFLGNSATVINDHYYSSTDAYGGAIYAGSVLIDGNTNGVYFSKLVTTDAETGEVTEKYNTVKGRDAYGGAIYSTGTIEIKNNSVANDEYALTFSYNKVYASSDAFGGAIAAGENSENGFSTGNTDSNTYHGKKFGYDVTLSNNGNILFSDNAIEADYRARGGAIYADGHIKLNDNGKIVFSNNSAHGKKNATTAGGAISTYLIHGVDATKDTVAGLPASVQLSGNADVEFIENTATGDLYNTSGGAIYSGNNVSIDSNTGNILFKENKVVSKAASDSTGGAISVLGGVSITENKGNIEFNSNVAQSNGGNVGAGAIYSDFGDITISNNGNSEQSTGGDVHFISNRVEGIGHYINESKVEVSDKAIGGGAIASIQGKINLEDNLGTVLFEGNHVIDSSSDTVINTEGCSAESQSIKLTGGGAVMAFDDISISGNGSVELTNNSAESESREAVGGALASMGEVAISGNKGDVTVHDNAVKGADHAAFGGAVFSAGLSIVNNKGNVSFARNYEKAGDSYVLRSLYIDGSLAGADSGAFELAAVNGKSITFNDSIYVGAGDAVKLNGYEGSTGDIIFSGATTVADLAQVKGGTAGTADEIEASRTSVINRNVSVAAGSLQVQSGAVLDLKGNALSVDNGAGLLLTSDSSLKAGDITIASGAEFSVQALKAATSLSASDMAPAAELHASNVTLMGGMVYTMDGAYTTLVGENNTLTLDVSNNSAYTFIFDESLAYQEGEMMYFVLFTGVDNLVGAKGEQINLADVIFEHNLQLQRDAAAGQPVLGYHAETGTVYVSMKGGSPAVPEPTTATLSLLALIGLAARRRRK